jgi:hypothetical protein
MTERVDVGRWGVRVFRFVDTRESFRVWSLNDRGTTLGLYVHTITKDVKGNIHAAIDGAPKQGTSFVVEEWGLGPIINSVGFTQKLLQLFRRERTIPVR